MGDHHERLARAYFEESLRISRRSGDNRYAAKTQVELDRLPRQPVVPSDQPSVFSQHTLVQVRRRQLVRFDSSVPAWHELSQQPAAKGLVRHGGVPHGVDHVGKDRKQPYADHAKAFLGNIPVDERDQPRTLLAFGSRNTFQNLGLPGWHRDRTPRLLCRPDEPWRQWAYHAICKLSDGGLAMLKVRFEPETGGEVRIVLDEASSITADRIQWAVTGQALLWDGAVSSLNQLACSTYDLRHLWDLRWEDWQNCPEHTEWHAELMDQFMQNLHASPEVRGGLLVEVAEKRGLKAATGYLHSSVGLNAAGDLILLMKTGSLLEIAAAQRRLGAERAILLDNGGSVGAAYWSRFAWQRSGWRAICERPALLGNGTYFRPRGHSVFVAELERDLPDGPTAMTAELSTS